MCFSHDCLIVDYRLTLATYEGNICIYIYNLESLRCFKTLVLFAFFRWAMHHFCILFRYSRHSDIFYPNYIY